MSDSGIFKVAVKLSPEQRAAYLAQACGANHELRREVESLLRAHEEAGSFLQSHPLGSAGTNLHKPVTEGPGTRIGPYKLLQQIGEGGMGVVYMAEQEQPVRRRVALKIIKPGLDSKQVIARFEAERQALALMDHAHIAKVLDAGATETGRPYFVMELIHGVPITRYCDENKLTLRQRLELFIPVCQAIQHAHQKGIIHRDLKPSNILVTLYDGQPVPKVIDFGVAKATEQRLTERTLFTQFGTIVGTFEYMAPEQAEMSALGVDTRSDVYSLGVLLYELLTGTTPLERKRLREAAYVELVRLIKEEEPPRPSVRLSSSGAALATISQQRGTEPVQLAKLVRGELDWIVMKALEKDRTRRYESANSLARDVERYLKDEAVKACPPSAGYKLRKFARKHRAAFITAAAFVVLLIVAALVSTALAVEAVRAWGEEATRRQEAEEQRQRAEQAEQEAKANAAKANSEAAIAQAVNEFLQKDLLGQADVANQEGGKEDRDPDVKVRTLLDRAAQSIEGKFQDQPLTEAAIRLTIGTTYDALAQFAKAQPHLERSVQLRTAELRADHPDTLTSKYHLADLYEHQGKIDQAVSLEQEVLQARSARLGGDHPDTLTSKSHLAWLYRLQRRYDKAVPLQQGLLQARLASLGPDAFLTARAKANLAVMYLDQGKYDLAEPLFLEALRTYEKTQQGPDHPRVLSCKNNLGVLYLRQGKYDRAEPLLREAVRVNSNVFGPDHPRNVLAKLNLAGLYMRKKDYERAEPLFRELLESRRRTHGPDSPQYVSALASLGQNLLRQNRFDEAESVLRESLAIYEKKAPNASATFLNKSWLGGTLLGKKQYTEAEPLLRQGYEGLKQREIKTAAADLTEVLEWLVQLYDATGQPEEAAKWRKQLEETKVAAKPPEKP